MIHAAAQKRRRAAWRLVVGIIIVGVSAFGLTLVLGHAPSTFEVTSK
jgi:threonine/homoserine/homoserine lactone efflux protein